MSLRVLLADDHTLYLEALKATLERSGFEVVGLAYDGQDAINECRHLQPDVAVLDASMPHTNGIEAAREIARFCPNTKTVILAERTDRCGLESLHAGVNGYLLKSDTAAELAQGIHLVSKGETYVTRSARDIFQAYKEGIQNTQALGLQERRVLRLIAEGKRTEEIAGILDISYETVRAHRKHIMDKLDARDTAGLVRYSIFSGLLEA